MKANKIENIKLSQIISRYNFLRYMSSIEFFIILYWLISSVLSDQYIQTVLPLSLSVVMIWINKEIFVSIKRAEDRKINNIVKLLKISLIIIVLSITITLINYRLLFPYINSKLFVLTYLSISLVIVSLLLNNAIKIRDKKDRVYKRYEEYKNKNNKSERINYV